MPPSTSPTIRAANQHRRWLSPAPTASTGDRRSRTACGVNVGGKKLPLGSALFDVAPAASANIDIKLSSANVQLVQKAKTLVVHVRASSHDDPASDKRASPGVPVQAKVTEGNVGLKPDKPLATPPKKKGKKKKIADRDHDGLPDSWEKKYKLNPKSKKDAKKDPDKDGLSNLQEFKLHTNPRKGDTDGDGAPDGKEVANGTEPTDSSSRPVVPPADTDGDGIPDSSDNCPTAPNPVQANSDGDSQGDACDPDVDGDGAPNTADNCVLVPNPHQADTDHDGLGDACDPDIDGDGLANGSDNCGLTPNASQADTDGDGLGDACDPDLDGDGVANGGDNCATTPNASQTDIDGDGVANGSDNCPTTSNPLQDNADGDGYGDACDPAPLDPNVP